MKKVLDLLLKIVLVIILFVPVSVVMLLLKLTSGKKLSNKEVEEFTRVFLDNYLIHICTFLGINNIPKLFVQEYNSGLFIKKEMFGIFRHGSGFDLSMDEAGCNEYINENVHTRELDFLQYERICIYNINIYNIIPFNHNLISKLVIISTIVHELTHYKQFLNNPKYNENYIDSNVDYVAYKKQDIEKEADKMGIKFVLYHLIDILKFILK